MRFPKQSITLKGDFCKVSVSLKASLLESGILCERAFSKVYGLSTSGITEIHVISDKNSSEPDDAKEYGAFKINRSTQIRSSLCAYRDVIWEHPSAAMKFLLLYHPVYSIIKRLGRLLRIL